MLGDGHVRDGGGKVYTTTSIRLAGEVQEIFQKVGSEAFVRCRNRIGRQHYIKGRAITVRHLCYEVVERRKFHTETKVLRASKQDYDGVVWCVTVPNRTVYVRRNGNAIWCGNSQDQTTAAFGGFNRIDFYRNEVKVTPMPPERLPELQEHLMLFFTGISRTATLIAADQIKQIPHREKQLTQLYHLVNSGVQILCEGGDIREFGRLLHEGWQLKRVLSRNISSDYIDHLYEQGRKAGATGGKLLGAGGGGFLLLFAEPDRQPKIRAAMGNLLEVPFTFEKNGSTVLFKGGVVYGLK
jgi:galactokinase/mevalonate kinase-like predicted kinase